MVAGLCVVVGRALVEEPWWVVVVTSSGVVKTGNLAMKIEPG